MAESIGRPAYQELADDLRARIAGGDLAIGDAIPSTTRLCEQYGVSVTVVRAAITQLRTEGVLRGQPGKAVYVVATPASIAADTASLEALAAQVRDLRENLDQTQARADDRSDSADLKRLEDEIAALRQQVARLQSHLIELYGKTGHPYPRERANDTEKPAERTVG